MSAPLALADEKHDDKGHDKKPPAKVVVIKKVLPAGSTDLSQARPAAGWRFTGTTSTAGVEGLPLTLTTGTDGAVAFQLTFTGDAPSAAVTVTETQQPGYELVTQGGANAVCFTHDDKGHTVAVTVRNAGPTGFGIDVAKKTVVKCVVYNRPVAAEVTVEKRWVIDGQEYAHGTQPAGFDAVLTLTGPGGAGATPQPWGLARGGYVEGETVTLDETVTIADASCTLDFGRVTAANGVAVDATLPYTTQLGPGANSYTITNQVTCPPPTPPVTPPVTPPTTPPVTPPVTPPAPSARPAPPAPQIEVQGQQRQGRPRLQVEKRASARTVAAGDTIRFTLVVRNTGNAVARGVRVCDQLPDNVTVVDRNGGRLVAGGRVCWRIRSLPAGATRTRSIVLRVDSDTRDGSILNRAFVRGEGQRRGAQRRVSVQRQQQQPSVGGEQVTG